VADVKFSSAMQKMQFEGLVEFIHQHNKLVSRINAATGDRDSLAESIRESDEFASIRNKIAELKEQLETAVNAKVDTALANANEDTTAIQEEVKELKSTITSGTTYYKKLYKDDTVDALPKVERVKGQRVGGGGGGKRIRGYNVIVTVGDEVTEYDNFAGAAKALGVGTADLQEQFYAKAGVEKLKDAPDEVSFGMSWTDVDEEGKETPVSATIKAYRTGPSGPPTANGDTATEADEAEVEVDEDDLETIS
jgi:hypothetical protein